jgi:hypothetical protein
MSDPEHQHNTRLSAATAGKTLLDFEDNDYVEEDARSTSSHTSTSPPVTNDQLVSAFAALALAVSSLRSAFAALIPTSSADQHPDHPKAPKVAAPPHFTGNIHESSNFLRHILSNISMAPSMYALTQQKILFLASYLKGSATAWFGGLLRRNATEYLDQRNILRRADGLLDLTFDANFQFDTSIYPYVLPELTDWAKFIIFFNANFADPNQRANAERKIRALRQITSVSIYASAFQSYCYDLDDTPRRIAENFYDGLKPAIKDELHQRGKPTTLEPMIHLALSIDSRLIEREFERSSERTSQYSATSSSYNLPRQARISAITDIADTPRPKGPLSDEERKHRFDNNLCLYCGKAGHTVQACRRSRNMIKISAVGDVPLDSSSSSSGNDSPQA